MIESCSPTASPPAESDVSLVAESTKAVQRWVEASDYKGYEPFDALNSPLSHLSFGNIFAKRVLMQIVRRCPLNLRPLIGVKRLDSTKGRGTMAWGYLLLHKHTGDPEYRSKAVSCLDWLDKHKSPKFEKHSWANYFDFASRDGIYYKDDSIIVWTSMIIQAFLEAFEQLQDERFLRVAQSACEWILSLPREKTDTGDCLSYFSHGQASIHNANMLGGAALARAYRHLRDDEYFDVAKSAMRYSCSRIREDGSWWYAEDPMFRWIDNFHTGYNLDSLKCFIDSTGDTEFGTHLKRGFAYFVNHFFEPSGCPKYYHDRTLPIDIQCASQAVDTLAYFAEEEPEALPLGLKVAKWTIDNMQEPDGHFQFRIGRFGVRCRTPMLHWGQATMFKGLAHLLTKLERPA